MILAKEKYDYRSWEAQSLNPVRKKQRKAVKQKKIQTKMGYLLIVVLAFAIGVIIASRYTQLIVAGYQLDKLNGELAVLQQENQQLNVELNKLKSLNRIEQIATVKLGMVEPDKVQFVAGLDASAPAPGAAAGAGRTNSGTAASKQGIMQELANTVALWAKGLTPAEAGTKTSLP